MEQSFDRFYDGKSVLVTGHTGFKGSWLTLWLLGLGAHVIGYSLDPPTTPSLFESLSLEEKVTHIVGDVRDLPKLKDLFSRYQPNVVFHLAAQAIVRQSYAAPIETFETNAIGTANVLEALRTTLNAGIVVVVTSDKCYDNKEWVHRYRECDPMGGYDPYSSSKGCAELITASYRNSFYNPTDYGTRHSVVLATVRAGNVLGGGDWAQDRIIPDCIRALVKNERIFLRSPNAIRPWQHVLEPLAGYLWLGRRLGSDGTSLGGAWNFGPDGGEAITVENIVRSVIEVWGAGKYDTSKNDRLYETSILALDTNKALFYLGWRPVCTGREAVEMAVDWYRGYYSRENTDMHEYSANQINEYTRKARNFGIEWSK